MRLWLPWLVLALVACAAPPSPPAPSPTPRPAAPPPTAAPTTAPAPTTAAPSPTPAPAEPLLVWAAADDDRRAALVQLLADTADAAGVPVQIVAGSSDGLIADVRAAQFSNEPLPDLIWGTGDDLAILHAAGIIQPAAGGLADDELLPAVVTGATIDGRRWGAPLAAQGFLLLLWNRQIVDEPPPATAAELASRARSLSNAERVGLAAGWAEARWFVTWLDGFGGAPLGADGRPALDTPATLQALELLRSLRRAGVGRPTTYDDGARLFRRGGAAYAIDGDWALTNYRRFTETLDLAIAPLPPVTPGGATPAAPLTGLYALYGAQLDGARLEQARAIVTLLEQPERQARIARDLGVLPARRALLSDPAVTADPALAAAAVTALRAPGIPPTRPIRCAWDAIEVGLPPVLLGELSPSDAVPRMQQRAAECAAS